eukprot:1190747-Prorocentrum_minimum.AAC.2
MPTRGQRPATALEREQPRSGSATWWCSRSGVPQRAGGKGSWPGGPFEPLDSKPAVCVRQMPDDQGPHARPLFYFRVLLLAGGDGPTAPLDFPQAVQRV